MAELTEKQIENVARWLQEQADRECSYVEPHARLTIARALALALVLPRVISHPDYDLVVETAATSTRCAMVNLDDWSAHVAAVKAITGEAE